MTKLLPLSTYHPSRYGRGTLTVSRCEQILLVALDRTNVKNAFNDDMYLDLVDVLHQVEQDDSLVAIVLTGRGSYFSSGADLKALQQGGQQAMSDKSVLERPTGRFMMTLLQFPKLFAAAVNGPAVGIGVTLLMHCDIVLCSDKATFWAPFTRLALGMCPSAFMSFFFSLPLLRLLQRRLPFTLPLLVWLQFYHP